MMSYTRFFTPMVFFRGQVFVVACFNGFSALAVILFNAVFMIHFINSGIIDTLSLSFGFPYTFLRVCLVLYETLIRPFKTFYEVIMGKRYKSSFAIFISIT